MQENIRLIEHDVHISLGFSLPFFMKLNGWITRFVYKVYELLSYHIF